MVGQADVNERPPAVAGLFYPRDPLVCGREAREYLNSSAAVRAGVCIGAIVPHAGWVCSGAIAGLAIATLAKRVRPDVVVVFGAIHSPMTTRLAMLDGYARWRVPAGAVAVADEIRGRLGEISAMFAVDDQFHRQEHAVEVELPLIHQAWPQAALLAIETPVVESAGEMGEQTAAAVEHAGLTGVYLASSDLTHYGPDYRLTPAGVGPAGLEWARNNDRRLLDQLEQLTPREIVRHVRRHHNACGGGAIAAMLGACRPSGTIRAEVLRHENSHDVLSRLAPRRADNAVGYAAVIVGVEGSNDTGQGCGTANALTGDRDDEAGATNND